MLHERNCGTARRRVRKRLSSANFSEFSSTFRWRAGLFLTLVVLAGLVTSAEAIKIATVRTLAESTEVSRLQKVLAVDPVNSKLHSRLSLFYNYSSEQLNLLEAVAQGHRATELNPSDFASCWKLALACESIEGNAWAAQACQRVLTLSPRKPRFWWATGPSISSPTDPRELLAATQGIGRGAAASGHSYSKVIPKNIQAHTR